MQHFDGTLEEFDPEDWVTARAEAAEPPEDWSGSVDINEEDVPYNHYTPKFVDWPHHIEHIDEIDIDLAEARRLPGALTQTLPSSTLHSSTRRFAPAQGPATQ